MCGIAGVYGYCDAGAIERMLAAMAHRGPDAMGVWVDAEGRIAIGNVRLSILDLSRRADMPMLSEDGRLCITYNGEIYNFKDIRRELERKGYKFFSNSDTEVILKSYVEWGKDCLMKLNGMFAFAIWDIRKGRLFLARDRFGIKPLYWSRSGKKVVFASELKGILASGIIDKRLDKQALWDYLSLGCVPPPETMIEGVHSLLPGHAMTVDEGGIDIWNYWDIEEAARKVDIPNDEDEILNVLRFKLEESLRRHMIADVEVGVFLSGGMVLQPSPTWRRIALTSPYARFP
ncbi:MAG: asparagine synthase (glutamine-hydrolyzing) [Candidatus Methanomethylicaceae archaeon]